MGTVGVAPSPPGEKLASTTDFRPAAATGHMSAATTSGRDA